MIPEENGVHVSGLSGKPAMSVGWCTARGTDQQIHMGWEILFSLSWIWNIILLLMNIRISGLWTSGLTPAALQVFRLLASKWNLHHPPLPKDIGTGTQACS